MNNSAQILIVEDEALVAEDIKAHVQEMGHAVSNIVSNGEDALTLLQGSQPDLVLMDIVLTGDVDGIDVAEVIKKKYHIPVIFLTAYTDREKVERATKTVPYGYLVKPFDERELNTTINVALYKSRLDRKLRENKRWAYAVLNSVEDGVITTDSHGRIHFMNPRAQFLCGDGIDASAQQKLSDVIRFQDPDQQAEFERSITLLLDQGNQDSFHINGLLQTTGSAPLPIEANFTRIDSEESSIDGIIFSFRDISVQYEARQKLEHHNEELERLVNERTESLRKNKDDLEEARDLAVAASKAKSEFITTMSHELRTPLNPILGFTQLLLDSRNLDEEQIRFIREIEHGATVLLEHFNDILILTEGNKQGPTDKQAFNLSGLLNDIGQNYAERARQKGLDFKLELPADLPAMLEGDVVSIKRILDKLLNNALKFTEAGHLGLKLETGIDKQSGRTSLLFIVSDTGIGITQEQQVSIFDLFTQIDSSMSRAYNGTGLGLSVSKLLVERMGGRIGVDSKPAKGSSFWFELNLHQVDI